MDEQARAAALTALDEISEFRVVYWTDRKARYYTVRRHWDPQKDSWAVLDGDDAWVGGEWTPMGGLPGSYRWSLKEALDISRRLAYEENQHIVAQMEERFPGEFRGSVHDFAATHTGAPTTLAELRKLQLMKLGQKIMENDAEDGR